MEFSMFYFGYTARSEKYVGWLRATRYAERSAEYASSSLAALKTSAFESLP